MKFDRNIYVDKKSLRQQNGPIIIKYPEMVPQIAPRFKNGVPEDAKDALWFL